MDEGHVLEIITDADPMLRRPSDPIGDVTDDVRRLAADMLATMYAASGIGLAAVQVGRPVRLLVLDAGPPDARRPIAMVDPVVERASRRTVSYDEGCLSIPGRRVPVERPSDVDVSYTDLDGVRQRRSLGGMPARIVQHEIDHLDGVLMTDRT